MGALASSIIMAVGMAASATTTIVAMNKRAEAAKKSRELRTQQIETQKTAMKEAREGRLKQEEQFASEQESIEKERLSGEKSKNRDSARARQRQAAKGAWGRSDTILAGSLNQAKPKEKRQKTLLGA